MTDTETHQSNPGARGGVPVCGGASVKRGFTIIELLASISIVAVLLSIILPCLAHARDRARDVRCTANLRTLWLETVDYARDHHEPERDMVTALVCPKATETDSMSVDGWYAMIGSEYLNLTAKGTDTIPGVLWYEPIPVHAGRGNAIDSVGRMR